jgi:hypothetical protein
MTRRPTCSATARLCAGCDAGLRCRPQGAAGAGNISGLVVVPEEGLADFVDGPGLTAGAGGSQGLWVLSVVDTAAARSDRRARGLCC